MPTGRERVVMRRTLVRHGALTALVAVVVSLLVTVGVVLFAQQDSYRSAELVGRQVASAVIVPLSHHDFAAPIEPERDDLRRDLAPFLTSGMVARVKVWTGPADRARIAFSDEPRVEGEPSRLDAETTRRIGAGDVLVRTVPDDTEHRFETPAARSLLEVFVSFRDVRGGPARLEVYVPVDVAGTARHTALAILPMVLAGIAALALATLPLSVALARRMERARAEQRAAQRYGLTAAEAGREEVARFLHDGVIPDLAGASLLLDAVRAEESGSGTAESRRMLDHAHDLLSGELRQLRTMLTDLVPPRDVGRDLGAAVRESAERLRPADGPRTDVDVDPGDDLDDATAQVIVRVCGELLRNAFRHADARRIRVVVSAADDGRVELAVSDDGRGFDADAPVADGHVGLLLVRRTVEDHAGTLTLHSAPGAGTRVVAVLPPAGRATGQASVSLRVRRFFDTSRSAHQGRGDRMSSKAR